MSKDLYLGIDIGKAHHSVALVSRQIIEAGKPGKKQRQPFSVPNTRAGFVALLARIETARSPNAPDAQIHVLLERTGHYGNALIQFLQEQNFRIYRTQPRKRYGRDKTDARDAATLAMLLYNQVELEIQPADPLPEIRPLVPPSALARRLRGLVQHRSELVREVVQRKNKLTAIMDELFPEFTEIFANPNSPSALAIRAAFPQPALICGASLDELCAARASAYPTRTQLATLQELAASTIGTKDPARLASAMIEQRQLIAEVQMLESHRSELDGKIEELISESREGQILRSLGIGTIQAATLLAGIGHISNFPSAAHFRSYLGWAPRRRQTGSTFDTDDLPPGGNKLLKHTMYLITLTAIRREPWKTHYNRLVERKCNYDERHGRFLGKMRVIGRVAGQLAGLIYHLLRRDHDRLASLPPNAEQPAPALYNADSHRAAIAAGASHQSFSLLDGSTPSVASHQSHATLPPVDVPAGCQRPASDSACSACHAGTNDAGAVT